MNGHLYFEIQADDAQRARQFYTEVFGWRFEKADGTPVEYWRIDTGNGRGGLLERPAATPPAQCGTNAFVCSMLVDDFDETAQSITFHGGQVALPKFLVPGVCWHGYFIDTEGNTFGIYQIADAVAS